MPVESSWRIWLRSFARAILAGRQAEPPAPEFVRRTDAAARALVQVNGHHAEFLYVVMTGIAAYGDRTNLEARALGAIRAAIEAADRATSA
jgi:hypothetical protein